MFDPDEDECFAPTPTDVEFLFTEVEGNLGGLAAPTLKTKMAVIQMKTCDQISRHFFTPDALRQLAAAMVEVADLIEGSPASNLIVPTVRFPNGFDPRGHGN